MTASFPICRIGSVCAPGECSFEVRLASLSVLMFLCNRQMIFDSIFICSRSFDSVADVGSVSFSRFLIFLIGWSVWAFVARITHTVLHFADD